MLVGCDSSCSSAGTAQGPGEGQACESPAEDSLRLPGVRGAGFGEEKSLGYECPPLGPARGRAGVGSSVDRTVGNRPEGTAEEGSGQQGRGAWSSKPGGTWRTRKASRCCRRPAWSGRSGRGAWALGGLAGRRGLSGVQEERGITSGVWARGSGAARRLSLGVRSEVHRCKRFLL